MPKADNNTTTPTARWPSYGKPGTALPLPVIPTAAPAPPAPPAPSRRALLGRSGAALLAGAAAVTTAHAAPLVEAGAAGGGDAELLRLRQAFLAEEKIIHAWNAGTVAETVHLRAMQDIPAMAAEGVRIKADCGLRALALGAAEDSGPTEDFIAAFLAQLAGRAAA